MSKYKFNMTRPIFLKELLSSMSANDSITENDVKKVIPEHYKLVYASYTAIMESDVNPSDIDYLSVDEDNSMTILFKDKKLAEYVFNNIKLKKIEFNKTKYKVKSKLEGKFIFISITEIEEVSQAN